MILHLLFYLYVFSIAVSSQSYTVYRNVKDFGAKGDGKTNDYQAIYQALMSGSRSEQPSTQTPAYVYFPSGTYLINETLPLVYYTQMVGEYDNLPIIKFVSDQKSDIRIIEAEGSWYHDAPQNNFYHSVRNFVIDMTECSHCTAIHWQVAQATSLSNIVFKMGHGTQNQGIWMENGSGGFVCDLIFQGGTYGMWVGNQQFTSRNITIQDASQAAIYLNWDWAWTFQGLYIEDCSKGIALADGTGSVTILDSHFKNVGVGISTGFSDNQLVPGANSVVIENVYVESNGPMHVVTNNGNPVLTVNSGSTIKSWVQGHVWENGRNTIEIKDLSQSLPHRPSILTQSDGKYFQQSRPNFPNMINVNTLGIKGDGSDITQNLQKALYNHVNNVLFFPHGIYSITDTVYVPPGTRLVGEVWSVLMASGTGFSDEENPKAMLKVGNPGEKGIAQFMDFLVSTNGPQPGAILIEWNMHDPDDLPGACAVWDFHFRIGGAIGTNIEPNDCPRGNGSNAPKSKCTGAWALMHITPSGSCYMENVWGWTADHDIDKKQQINVYNGRGFLCESQGPVWLYGTAMEHSIYYQYNFVKAENIMMGMIQTETPYYQPSQDTPFNPSAPTDPIYCKDQPKCNMSFALHINTSQNIFIYGAGLYSFFNTWDQSCLTPSSGPECQIDIVKIWNSKNIYFYALNTYGSVYMLTSEESYSKASDNKNTFCSTGIVNLNLFN